MPKPKKDSKPSLVVVPPPPKVEKPGAVPLSEQSARRKRPVAPREHPSARDTRGKATRSELRKTTARIAAPRATSNPPERSRQTRSHRAGKKQA